MSCGSDIDEFYDAEDTTPVRQGQRHQDSIESEESEKIDFDEEERKLLELKRLAEERRKEEDAELERRLKHLEEKKRFEEERKEAKKKAEENEKRRQKLNIARDLLEGETSPVRTPPKPPRFIDFDDTLSGDVEEDGDMSLFMAAGSTTPGSADLNININMPGLEQDKVPSKVLAEMMEAVDIRTPSSNGGARPKEVPQLNLVDSEDTESDQTPTEADPVPMMQPAIKTVSEPDIVQSTKKEPPPRPVAPPRKKRPTSSSSRQSGEATEQEGASSSVPTFPEAKGLPTSDNHSAVSSLMKDLEQSLDLQSATSGHRHIVAIEEASSKAETTEEEELCVQKDEKTDLTPGGILQDALSSSTALNLGNSKNEDLILIMDKTGQKIPASMVALLLQHQHSGAKKEDGTTKRFEDGDGEEKIGGLQRPRSHSGSRYLTDQEILDQVMVLNLDTGERIPLSAAEEKLPRCMNPLSLHIMRRTKEYSSDSSLHKNQHSDDEESKAPEEEAKTIRAVKFKKKTIKIRRFFGKTVNKLKSVADEVLHGEGGNSSEDDEDDSLSDRRMIKIKASSHNKGPYDFDLLVPVQDLSGEHNGAVWTMKFSHCGRLLATGGQDNLLRIWVLKDSYAYFDDMRKKYTTKVSPASSKDSLNSGSSDSQHSQHSEQKTQVVEEEEDEHAPFMRQPYCVYKGHTADLLDLSWSKNYFVLSSSMDKTVRLWHISRRECLCSFQHIDFVTAIAFHPKDDRYFLSGSLDGKLRLWNIPDKKVALWNEIVGNSKLITTANFCLGGRFAVCGTYDGRCIFYSTEQLKYYTQIHVRSTRGKNARGRKLTGIEPVPGEDKILVTSNDSRVRLYDLRDLTLTCKYKGCANNSSQIKASFSCNGKYIICGSEDHFVYIWKTKHENYKFTSARRDRNDFWEGIKAHTAVVTAAVFAPNPGLIIKPQFEHMDSDDKDKPPEVRGEVVVSADFSGAIKVFINKFKPGSG